MGSLGKESFLEEHTPVSRLKASGSKQIKDVHPPKMADIEEDVVRDSTGNILYSVSAGSQDFCRTPSLKVEQICILGEKQLMHILRISRRTKRIGIMDPGHDTALERH